MIILAKKIANKLVTAAYRLRGASIQHKSLIYHRVEIQTPKKAAIGKNSILYKNVTIYNSHDGNFSMGDNSHLAPFCYLLIGSNTIKIGNDVAIGPFTSMFCHSNTYSKEEPLFRKNYADGDISIGSNVFIGAHTVIHPNSTIEDNVIVASNSVVKGTLESGYIYAGIPAKKIKSVND